MSEIAGMIRPDVQDLPQISDRMTFIYLEHCKINREDSSITVLDERGITHIPSAVISVLMLGPGTEISHRAMELIGDSGVNVCWIGEHGVRFYAGGRALTTSSRMIVKQAELVSNQRKHLDVVRKMYSMRFPNEDVSGLTLQQLRGREGSRMRKVYRNAADTWNIEWNGREYDPDDFSASDEVNQSLSAANACLYGLAHAVICAIGCSPALGFIHVGHELSFVYDIADLYKADISIPVAFEIASKKVNDLPREVRLRMRDEFAKTHLLERMVHDIKFLLNTEEHDTHDTNDKVLYLWDNKNENVDSGRQYASEEEWS